jgi:hypothetical protein
LRVGGIDVVIVVVSVVVVVMVMVLVVVVVAVVVVVIMQFVPSRPENWMTTVCNDARIRRGRTCLYRNTDSSISTMKGGAVHSPKNEKPDAHPQGAMVQM